MPVEHFCFDNDQVLAIAGQHDENIREIERLFDVRILLRGGEINVSGPKEALQKAVRVIHGLEKLAAKGEPISRRELAYLVRISGSDSEEQINAMLDDTVAISSRGKLIRAKTIGQKHYVDLLKTLDIVFAIGPAGTGKTFLAIAQAVTALQKKLVNKIVLTRPAVEAGEKLGFLPGDMQEKVDPYLRPLYDALNELLGADKFQKYMERGIIEVAPLAYMRGRTLDDAYIILDEAQNTTQEQMKMFLTRMGYGSTMVITGDITQVDLPRGRISGLVEAEKILSSVPGIGFVYLTSQDVVRHPLVQSIIEAYEKNQAVRLFDDKRSEETDRF